MHVLTLAEFQVSSGVDHMLPNWLTHATAEVLQKRFRGSLRRATLITAPSADCEKE